MVNAKVREENAVEIRDMAQRLVTQMETVHRHSDAVTAGIEEGLTRGDCAAARHALNEVITEGVELRRRAERLLFMLEQGMCEDFERHK